LAPLPRVSAGGRFDHDKFGDHGAGVLPAAAAAHWRGRRGSSSGSAPAGAAASDDDSAAATGPVRTAAAERAANRMQLRPAAGDDAEHAGTGHGRDGIDW